MRADPFEGMLERSEQKLMARLTSPAKIQEFLDQTSYSTEDIYRCPLRVLRERRLTALTARFRSGGTAEAWFPSSGSGTRSQ